MSSLDTLKSLISVIETISGTSTSATALPKGSMPIVSPSIESVKYDDKMTEMTRPVDIKNLLEQEKVEKYLKGLIDDGALTLVEKHSPFGKIKQLVLNYSKNTNKGVFNVNDGTISYDLNNEKAIQSFVDQLNENPSLINAHLRPKIAAALDLSKPVSKTTKTDFSKLEKMEGGANIVGEFQAIKNTLAIEKSTMELIGGGEWAPALAPEATQKARLFTEILSKLEEQLQSHGKTLEDGDKKALVGAIQSLSEHERNAFTQLSYLKKYVALAAQHKDGKGDATKELGTLDLKTYVEKYFKTLKKAEKKSAKLMGVFGSLIGDAAIILA